MARSQPKCLVVLRKTPATHVDSKHKLQLMRVRLMLHTHDETMGPTEAPTCIPTLKDDGPHRCPLPCLLNKILGEGLENLCHGVIHFAYKGGDPNDP